MFTFTSIFDGIAQGLEIAVMIHSADIWPYQCMRMQM